MLNEEKQSEMVCYFVYNYEVARFSGILSFFKAYRVEEHP